MHGSIINHLRDSPLKKHIQQRMVGDASYGGGRPEAIPEEDNAAEDDYSGRPAPGGTTTLDNTATRALRLTGRNSQQQRLDNMMQHNWHKKFLAYKN